MSYSIHFDKNIAAAEFAALMESVGWGSNYSEDSVQRSLAAYPFIAHARDDSGALVGYISAFSDRAFSTQLGELVVHPEFRRQGIARTLLKAVETEFPGVPVYAKALGVAKPFFAACGYRPMSAEVRVLFNRNGMDG